MASPNNHQLRCRGQERNILCLLIVIVFFGLRHMHSSSLDFHQMISQVDIKQAVIGALQQQTPISSSNETAGQQAAWQFVRDRQAAYEEHGQIRQWHLRGVGYLFSKLHIVLLASLPEKMSSGRNVVTIKNVYNNSTNDGMIPRSDCDKLTIWVRVNGPEITAGSAVAVQPSDGSSSCHWEFPFNLQVEGKYHVDAKVLLWNGLAYGGDTNKTASQCQVLQGNVTREIENRYPVHSGFIGFKMYRPAAMCCEICSRMSPHCKYWATPPSDENKTFTRANNGCELYFEKSVPQDVPPVSFLLSPNSSMFKGRSRRLSDDDSLFKQGWTPQGVRRLGQAVEHGYPYENEFGTAYFLGCGWSYHFTLDYPCLSADLDDQAFMLEQNFTFNSTSDDAAIVADTSNQEEAPLPLCTPQHEEQSNGRWVRRPWPSNATCPLPMTIDPTFQKRFSIVEFDPEHPICWHRDDLRTIGDRCREMNCALIPKGSKWISSVHMEDKWFGVWKKYNCDFLEFTDSQLQQCINNRNISSFRTQGASIAEYLREYLEQRLQNRSMFNASDPSAITIILDTFSLGHKAHAPNADFEKFLEDLPVVPANEEHYVANSFYLSSEREVHAHVGRMDYFNKLMLPVIRSKGYKLINMYGLSAAFTYDTATQFDGMHMIGPPMKMVITKLFHHVCSGHAFDVGQRIK